MTNPASFSSPKAGAAQNMPWVSIIIVNYNAGHFLQKAVDKVAEQTDQSFELILLDNASTDGSIESLRTDHIQNFKLIALDENLGFAAGNNLASQKAKGDWIALLNPDTEVAPDWLSAFKCAKNTHYDTVMFAGATVNTSHKDILDGAGDCYFGFGIPWRGGYGRPRSELPGIGECFSACGASALIHRRTFLDIGGFDERFFCYCEDVDLGYRFRLEGHRCIFWPEALAYHHGSGTTSLASDFSIHYGTRNRLWTFVKNTPPLGLFFGFPVHIILTLALLVRANKAGRGSATWTGLKQGILGLRSVWKDRKAVQFRRQLSTWEIARAMSWKWSLLRHRKVDVRPLRKQNTTNPEPQRKVGKP